MQFPQLRKNLPNQDPSQNLANSSFSGNGSTPPEEAVIQKVPPTPIRKIKTTNFLDTALFPLRPADRRSSQGLGEPGSRTDQTVAKILGWLEPVFFTTKLVDGWQGTDSRDPESLEIASKITMLYNKQYGGAYSRGFSAPASLIDATIKGEVQLIVLYYGLRRPIRRLFGRKESDWEVIGSTARKFKTGFSADEIIALLARQSSACNLFGKSYVRKGIGSLLIAAALTSSKDVTCASLAVSHPYSQRAFFKLHDRLDRVLRKLPEVFQSAKLKSPFVPVGVLASFFSDIFKVGEREGAIFVVSIRNELVKNYKSVHVPEGYSDLLSGISEGLGISREFVTDPNDKITKPKRNIRSSSSEDLAEEFNELGVFTSERRSEFGIEELTVNVDSLGVNKSILALRYFKRGVRESQLYSHLSIRIPLSGQNSSTVISAALKLGYVFCYYVPTGPTADDLIVLQIGRKNEFTREAFTRTLNHTADYKGPIKMIVDHQLKELANYQTISAKKNNPG